MMAAILNSATLDSTILKKKNPTHSLSLNLMMTAILDWAILHKKLHSFLLTQLDDGSHLEFCHVGFRHCYLGFRHLVYLLSDSLKNTLTPLWTLTQANSIWLIWWWEPSWILPSWIQPFCTKLWLKLIQSDSDSFILTQLDDVRHHEFCHLGFNHFEEKKPHSFIVTQLDDDSHLGFSHFAQKNFTHSFWLNLMMAANLNSAMVDSDTGILDSDTLLSSLRFTQKHSHYSLTLTQTNSIWLKLIHSYLTWWCQPSWNLPSWIHPFWTKKNFTHSFWPNFMMAPILGILPSWIQKYCTKLCLKLISFSLNLMMSDILNSAILDSANLYKKNFTHLFWLNFMMAAILNSTIFDSNILHNNTSLIHSDSSWWWQQSWILPCWILATAILDSDTLLSSFRFTQKHSHSNLTLTQTNSI